MENMHIILTLVLFLIIAVIVLTFVAPHLTGLFEFVGKFGEGLRKVELG
ncbi:MAG: hypothetical protein JSV92_01110 [archaeon]|nr:MAG: hypothetical protein JSV92_01110 [archaeon]